jgi:hypothetical protein
MRRSEFLVLLTALVSSLLLGSPAGAESSRPDPTLSLAQAERIAADLKQGMSLDDVQKLLGKPRRTALKSDGASPGSSKGTLQWTYNWTNTSAQGNLRVEFASKSLLSQDEWAVSSWEWLAY